MRWCFFFFVATKKKKKKEKRWTPDAFDCQVVRQLKIKFLLTQISETTSHRCEIIRSTNYFLAWNYFECTCCCKPSCKSGVDPTAEFCFSLPDVGWVLAKGTCAHEKKTKSTVEKRDWQSNTTLVVRYLCTVAQISLQKWHTHQEGPKKKSPIVFKVLKIKTDVGSHLRYSYSGNQWGY